VFAEGFKKTGSYSIGLECLLPPSFDVVSLSCGGLVEATIEAVAETDLYSFVGTAGDQISITLAQTEGFSSGYKVTTSIYSPNGEEIESFWADNQKDLVLEETGTYVIRVYARDFKGTGSYSLSLICF
jgi:hypothetical protein